MPLGIHAGTLDHLAASVAVVISDHCPFSPRVLIQGAMEMAVLPPSPERKSARIVGLDAIVRKDNAAGSVGADSQD